MSKLEFHSRVSWTQDLIVSDWTLTGHPPGHSERKWSDVEAWGVGRPVPNQLEGLWMLMRHAPYYHFISNRAVGVIALEGELRRRGCSERNSTEVKQQADARAFRDLRIEVGGLFGDGGEAAWQALEETEVCGMVDVRTAIVRLSKGDRARLDELIATAAKDPRDVLMWAQADHLI